MGVGEVLVSSPVFKTVCGARVVPGGFDSHALPPKSLCIKGFNHMGKNVKVVDFHIDRVGAPCKNGEM